MALSPRQFSLLEYFLRHAGEVLPKSRILEHVWDFTFDGDPNIVEVYVRQLRLRVDEPFGRSALQTVRGVGYRLDARRWLTDGWRPRLGAGPHHAARDRGVRRSRWSSAPCCCCSPSTARCTPAATTSPAAG